jgi:hypothetical protein
MKDIEEQMEGAEDMRVKRETTSPLDVEGIDFGISADEIVQFVAEGRRSRPPMIEKAATGQPIPALNANELAAIEVDEEIDITRAVKLATRRREQLEQEIAAYEAMHAEL